MQVSQNCLYNETADLSVEVPLSDIAVNWNPMTRGQVLPLVLLGIRKALKESAELVLIEVVIEIALVPFNGLTV